MAEAHEQQEPDPVEEERGEECREEDEVVAEQRAVTRVQVKGVVEGGKGQECETFTVKYFISLSSVTKLQ